MKYTISCEQPNRHLLDFELQIDEVHASILALQLPSWRPGRYEMQDFAKNIFSFAATAANGAALPVRKTSKDRWVIETAQTNSVTVRYQYLAVQMDAGGTWVDEEQFYINWITCAMRVEGRESEKIKVVLDVPRNYEVASSLPGKGRKRKAPNFEALVDAPIIASPTLQHASYEMGGCLFHVWVQGDCRIDWERLLRDFRAFTKVQIQAFDGFPCEAYHFMIQALPYRHYHGVEHQYSTVITLGPSEQLMGKLYDDLLGVSSHELYHTWNATRLRPKEMVPYKWNVPNYFTTGFVAEGVTTYYGDLMLCRGGVWDIERYVEELNNLFAKHFPNEARHRYALTDASFDLWLDGYSPRKPKRHVSIYAKGALVALLLDLRLQLASGGAKGLDDVMRTCWSLYASGGYTEEDYRAAVAKHLGNKATASYFDECIGGTADLWPLLSDLLPSFGLEAVQQPAPTPEAQHLGFQIAKQQGAWVVSDIAPASPAEAWLCLGDQLVAVNGRRVLQDAIGPLLDLAPQAELAVFRNNILKTVRLKKGKASYFPKYTVQRKESASNEEVARLHHWLGKNA